MSAFHYEKRLILNNVERVSVHNWWKQLLTRAVEFERAVAFEGEGGSSTILQCNCSRIAQKAAGLTKPTFQLKKDHFFSEHNLIKY